MLKRRLILIVSAFAILSLPALVSADTGVGGSIGAGVGVRHKQLTVHGGAGVNAHHRGRHHRHHAGRYTPARFGVLRLTDV